MGAVHGALLTSHGPVMSRRPSHIHYTAASDAQSRREAMTFLADDDNDPALQGEALW